MTKVTIVKNYRNKIKGTVLLIIFINGTVPQ